MTKKKRQKNLSANFNYLGVKKMMLKMLKFIHKEKNREIKELREKLNLYEQYQADTLSCLQHVAYLTHCFASDDEYKPSVESIVRSICDKYRQLCPELTDYLSQSPYGSIHFESPPFPLVLRIKYNPKKYGLDKLERIKEILNEE